MGSPHRPEFFSRPYFYYCSSSVHYCEIAFIFANNNGTNNFLVSQTILSHDIFQGFASLSWQLYFPNKHHSMHLVFGLKSLVTNGHVRLRIFDRSFQIYSFFRLQNCNYVEDFYANFLNLTGSFLKINIIISRF